jgi:hypothetical protein
MSGPKRVTSGLIKTFVSVTVPSPPIFVREQHEHDATLPDSRHFSVLFLTRHSFTCNTGFISPNATSSSTGGVQYLLA